MSVTESRTVRALKRILFADIARTVFTIMDGASVPRLLATFAEYDQDEVCLFRGNLEPEMAEVAPYLVMLEQEAPFTGWLLSNGWGNHWGIFGSSSAEPTGLRRHFRKYLTVYDESGKSQYFRYYDPRVLRSFLPTCSHEVLKAFFGPVSWYLAEDADEDYGIRFKPGETSMLTEKLLLGDGAESRLPWEKGGVKPGT